MGKYRATYRQECHSLQIQGFAGTDRTLRPEDRFCRRQSGHKRPEPGVSDGRVDQ
jgi:hypothetical protein